MIATKGLLFMRCAIPNFINHAQLPNSTNVLKYAFSERGYVASLFNNKLQNVRYMCNNTSSSNNIELEKVYYGLLTPQIKAVKIISFTTSIGGLAAQPILLQQVTKMGAGIPVIVGLCSFLGFFTFITPLLLHFVTKKYITHLDYNPVTKKYVATVLTFFCRQEKIEFSVDDVKVPDIPGMFTTFLVKGRPLFVDPNVFLNPTHYGRLMGYDKPIDFKMYQTEVNTTKKGS